MNIKRAYLELLQKEFVDWAIENKYPYFIVIEGNREYDWIYPKRGGH
jgi:lipocalin